MAVVTRFIECETRGFTDIQDITEQVQKQVTNSGLDNGVVTVFVPGSTAAVTTLEYEPGLKRDLPELLEKLIPMHHRYHHDDTWHDGNGYAHLRAALVGPSLTVPFCDRTLQLGTWQQIVFVDFDNRPRRRRLLLQIIGEPAPAD